MAKEIFYRIKIGGDDVVLQRAEDIRAALREINKQLKVTEDNDAYDQLEQEALKLKAALREVNREQANQVRQFEAANTGIGSYRRLNAELVEARQRFKELSREEREGSIGENLRQDIQRLDKELKEIDGTIGQFQRNVGDYRNAVSEALGGIIPGFSELEGVIQKASGAAGGLGKVLAIGFGAFAIGSALFAATGEIREFVDELTKLRTEINQVTGAVGDDLDNLSSRAQAAAQTFGEDAGEIARAANTLSKEFDIGLDEAIGLIEDGFVRGLNASGEFLQQLREYPAQFAAAGFSADQFLGVIQRQVTEGIFSDKGVDAIKEATISLRELPKTATDALEAVGISGEQIRAVIAGEGIAGAIRLVSERLGEFEDDSVEVGQVLADVFKGAGEDAGVDFVKSLKDIDEGLAAVVQGGSEYVERQRGILEANKELAAAQVEVTKRFEGTGETLKVVGTNLKTFFLQLLLRALDVLAPFIDAIRQAGASFGELLRALGLFQKEGAAGSLIIDVLTIGTQKLVDGAITLINVITTVVSVLADFVQRTPIIRESVQAIATAWQALREVMQTLPAIWSGVRAAAEETGRSIARFFEDVALRSEILLKQVERLNPFGRTTEQVDEEIENLRRKRTELEAEGIGIARAFAKGYAEGLENLRGITQEAVSDAAEAGRGAAGATGRGGGTGGRSGLTLAEKKELEEQAKQREQARKERLKEEERKNEQLKKLREQALSAEAKAELEHIELLRELAKRAIAAELEVMSEGRAKALAEIQERSRIELQEAQKLEEKFLQSVASREEKLLEAFGESAEEVQQFRAQAAQQQLEVEERVAQLRIQAEERLRQGIIEVNRKFDNDERERELAVLQEQLSRVDIAGDELVNALEEQRAKGELSVVEFADELFEVQRERILRQLELVQSGIEGLQSKVKLGAGVEGDDERVQELLRLKQELNTALAKLDEERTEKVEQEAQKQLSAFQNTFAQVGGFVEQGFQVVSEFLGGRNQRELEALEEQREIRQQNIESLRGQLQGATRAEKEELNKRIKQEEAAIAQIEKEKIESEKKVAKSEKAGNIVRSIMNTALAVTKALPNIILAAIVGGLGAAQTGIIAAQPAAEGGEAGLGELVDVISGARVMGSPNLTPGLRGGDNVLIAARRGEVVLNERQQKLLGGAATFRAIGVRGFHEGGIVGAIAPAPSVGTGSGGVVGVLEGLDKKTDAINNRIDRLRTFVVSDDLEEDRTEREFVRTLTQL